MIKQGPIPTFVQGIIIVHLSDCLTYDLLVALGKPTTYKLGFGG